ncbi:hypothetical protein I4J22_06080 [Corynebacterium diphtheriae]|uniref:hypothetical protein n=1 Tax=Corynebacterium diphtheriae TaxID=1717 RepID=UPI000245B422|nr:hypothetical protein [Corynebacterium diphtheriae]AEX45785.1 hypothetical protein CDB402_0474 [Corynebacterium diphtheriae INCA 402]MBG9228492.1 hypothetical protein [Corynebacterium diphtheriae bv. gravis]MBG9251283.1 hypothetical protein [Corynebacterium diphtheriae bv. mitis]MBG9255475.1 hypothetical protein [Corynebacterium diphtheriae bv. mitis]MBG9262247.1 hypothetical protein [Corynebacterium diphtheriae bv. mitis]
MTPDVTGYGRAVSDLHAASAGLYSGPAITQEALAKAAGTTKGLRTDALRNTAQAMVGGSSTAFVTDKFWGSLIKILAQIATSFIASGLLSLAERWLGGSDDADNIQVQSHQASDAIDCVDQEATTNIATVISQLTAMIGQLVATLAGIDKKENPEAFAECVSAGAQAIDSAGKTIKQTCESRDEAIEQCFSTLTHRTEEKCSVQDPPPPPACTGGASGGAPAPAPATQPAGGVAPPAPPAPPAAGGRSSAGGGATDILGAVGSLIRGLCEDSTTTEATTEVATQTTTETVEKTCEKANEKNTRVDTTTSVTETETCLEKEKSEVVVVDCKPETKSCEQTCIASGVIGAVGLGIAVLGIGALIHCITESMGAFECVPPPPTPDVPPPPAPAPPPVIDNVPEPPPPPKQIPGMVPAAAPAPPPAPPAPEPPAPAPLSSHINVKKAGSW